MKLIKANQSMHSAANQEVRKKKLCQMKNENSAHFHRSVQEILICPLKQAHTCTYYNKVKILKLQMNRRDSRRNIPPWTSRPL